MLYFLLEPILSPIFEMMSGFLESIEVLIAIYIVLMILSDFTEKKVFQHFFSTARALFFMDYLFFFMGDSLFTASCKSLSLTVNLTWFYTVPQLSVFSF